MRSQHGDGSGALRIAAAVAVMLCAGMAAAQSTPKPASASDICAKDDDDDEEGKAAKPAPLWKRFTFEGACVELSGSLGATYQKQKASAGVASVLTTGCAWADCPPTYGPYRLLFWRYRRWLRRGLWETMAAASSGHGSAPMPARLLGLVAGVSPGRSKG